MDTKKINILLVEDNKDFAKLVKVYLQRFDKDAFSVVWKENHADALAERVYIGISVGLAQQLGKCHAQVLGHRLVLLIG